MVIVTHILKLALQVSKRLLEMHEMRKNAFFSLFHTFRTQA